MYKATVTAMNRRIIMIQRLYSASVEKRKSRFLNSYLKQMVAKGSANMSPKTKFREIPVPVRIERASRSMSF